MPAFGASGEVGSNFNTSYYVNATTNPEYPNPPFLPGTTQVATDGSVWTFVRLANSQTIAAGDFVYVSSTDNSWAVTSLANAAKALLGSIVGVAGAAATSTTTGVYYIWIQRAGYNSAANCTTSAAANTALHTTATGGRLNSSGSAGTTATVAGVVATATAAANVAPVQLNFATIGVAD